MNQFRIRGYIRGCGRNRFGNGLILYINENIPCRSLSGDHFFF